MDCSERLVALLALALAACLPAAASSPSWVSTVRKDHPRLFFNRETWPAVRARAMGAERDWYGWLKGRVEGCPADPPEKEWGTEAAAAAFVWLMTRDRKHLDKATKLLRASVAWYDTCTRSGRSVDWYSSARINAWAALDWLWNDLPPEERRGLGLSFLEHVEKVQPGSGLRLSPRWNTSGPETGFYGTPSLLWYSGLVLHGEGIDDARALDFMVRGHDLYGKLLAHRGRCAGDDGGSASASLNYCLGAYPWAEHNFFFSWLSATGEDIAPAWPHVASLSDYIFWNRLPGGQEFGSGDAYHLNNRIGTTHLWVHFSNIMHLYAEAEPRRAALARWMRETWTRPSRGVQWTWPVQPFLRTRIERCPPLAPPPKSLPLARHFENMGQVFMRSGSGENDTYLMLTSGGLVRSHKQFDNNHFALYRGGFLALDAGTRPEPGQHLSHYYCRTVAHNCVTIRMPGEKLPRYWGTRAPGEEALPVPNDGGQLKPLGSKVVAFETNDAFAYVASDATEAYGGKCSLCLRQLVFVPPAHVVIFDRVTAANAGYEKRWLFHTAAEPAIEADAFSAEHEKGRVLCRTLLPQDAQLSKIGGSGRQFWSDGRNWPLPKGWRRNVTGEEPLLGQWRVEVRPPVPRKADAFLHLIELRDSNSAARMTPHELIADRNSPGVAFDAPGGRRVEVRFGVDGPASGHIRIRGGGRSIDRELTRTVQKQAGLTGESDRKPQKLAPQPTRVTTVEPPRPVDPLAPHAKELARARQDAQAGRYERAAEAVERLAASEKTKAAKDALVRVARGFRAAARLRAWIVEGVEDGRHARVYVQVAGRTMRGTLASADESGVRVRVAGSEMPLRWDEIPPRRLLAMARKYAPEDGQPLLDDFAFAMDFRPRRRAEAGH